MDSEFLVGVTRLTFGKSLSSIAAGTSIGELSQDVLF